MSTTDKNDRHPNQGRDHGYEVPWPPKKGGMWLIGFLAGAVLTFWAGITITMATTTPVSQATPEPTNVPEAAAGPETTDMVRLGETVALSNGCISCHTTDGTSGVGPTWEGLWEREVQLTDGQLVVADEDYLRRAILDPGSQVVDGYQPIMPDGFANQLSDDELDALIAFIQSLR